MTWLPQMTGSGTVHAQYRRCGRPNCRCREGQRHVGYYFFWRESGRLRKRYLRAGEVEAVRAACEERRRRQRQRRHSAQAARASWRALAAYLRGVEHHD